MNITIDSYIQKGNRLEIYYTEDGNRKVKVIGDSSQYTLNGELDVRHALLKVVNRPDWQRLRELIATSACYKVVSELQENSMGINFLYTNFINALQSESPTVAYKHWAELYQEVDSNADNLADPDLWNVQGKAEIEAMISLCNMEFLTETFPPYSPVLHGSRKDYIELYPESVPEGVEVI